MSATRSKLGITARQWFFLFTVVAPLAVLALGLWWWRSALWGLVVVVAIIAVGTHDLLQRRRSLLRIYPVLGHGRFLAERIRPEIQQYFVESDTNGTPFTREIRSAVYQRAKHENDALPFGTQRLVYEPGYEYLAHSLTPATTPDREPPLQIGGPECAQPYASSRLNISAMSFGSLSPQAIEALNAGAQRGGFAHNTGEGSVSPYHRVHGGDLIWQIGTGYFGCRTVDGGFDPDGFAETATTDQVKMIEVKLSQGAKPGHGGILPGPKVSPEIAATRGVPIGQTIVSPPVHRTFDDPIGLLQFVSQLRELSGGKPVGFKLCVGRRHEFLAIARAMLDTGHLPDFITVDGGEGGTGAAPLELSDFVGMPMRDAVHFVDSTLRGVGLRDRVRVLAAGKVATGMDMVRALALGADGTNAARSMMLALGCIQSRRCHDNTCPVGVATQDPGRARGLVVENKAQRVAAYHQETVEAFLQLTASMGCEDPVDLDRGHVMRRIDERTVASYDQLYPVLGAGSLLESGDAAPPEWRAAWAAVRPDSFA